MTIELQEPNVTDKLPPARLYLDDIEQIVRIFLQTIAAREGEPTTGDNRPEPAASFQILDRLTRDIADLPKIAKTTNDLAVKVESERSPIALAVFIGSGGASWQQYGLTRAEAWDAYHKLDALFKPRSNWLKTWLHRSAKTFLTALAASFTVTAALIVLAIRLTARDFARAHAATLVIPMMVGALIVSLTILDLLTGGSPCTVVLRYSHDQAARREERNSKLLFAALGWALGTTTTLLSIYVKHKFWP